MAEKEVEKETITPIEGGEPIARPQSIQDIAKVNYEKAEALQQEGKQPPPLPATPVNLASFQNQETLPEDKRGPLAPVDIPNHPKAQERAQQRQEEKQREQTRKEQSFENVPPTPEGSVTAEILGEPPPPAA